MSLTALVSAEQTGSSMARGEAIASVNATAVGTSAIRCYAIWGSRVSRIGANSSNTTTEAMVVTKSKPMRTSSSMAPEERQSDA